MNDQIPSRFLSLIHDRLQRRAFNGRPQTAASRAAEINIAAHQRRDPRRTADNNSFIFQAFVLKKSFGARCEDG